MHKIKKFFGIKSETDSKGEGASSAYSNEVKPKKQLSVDEYLEKENNRMILRQNAKLRKMQKLMPNSDLNKYIGEESPYVG